jgi:uncharacterized membrane protein (UPF0136 family)
MKKQSIMILCYSVLTMVGGLMGYLLANSLVSLIASFLVTSILCTCALFIWNGNRSALQGALFVLFLLTMFFSYRYFITQKIAPSAIMSIITGLLFVYIFKTQPKEKLVTNKL